MKILCQEKSRSHDLEPSVLGKKDKSCVVAEKRLADDLMRITDENHEKDAFRAGCESEAF